MEPNRVIGFCLSILADIRFSLLLFNSISKKLDVLLYFKACSSYSNKQDGKAINILKVLIYLVKPQIDLITFLQFGHTFNLDFIAITTLYWVGAFRVDC